MTIAMSTRSDLIRRCFAAYQSRDRGVLEKAFADDFTFTSPYDDHISRAEYFERCWPVSASGRMTNEIERIFEQDEQAFVTYRVVMTKGENFRNTEFFVFEGEKIKSIDVYFGASYRDGQFVKQKDQ
jgi:ketosteroid isomerase-like protein